MSLRVALKYAGGLFLAAALMWWVLRGTDPGSLWTHLREASIPGLIAAAVLNTSHNVFRVFRWRALLEPVRAKIPFRPMFDAVILGYTTSWTVPGRLGEIVRPVLLSGRERLPLAPCLASVLVDRLLDGLAVLALFGVGMAVTPLRGESIEHTGMIRGGAVAVIVLIGVPILVLLVAGGARGRLESLLGNRRGWTAWLGRAVLSLSGGVEAFRRPALVARIVMHTGIAWLLIASGTWVGVRACGVDISFGGILVMLPLLVLGIALPTPGGAGGYHAMMRLGLIQLFGVAESQAVGAGLLQHAVIVVPIILLGGGLLIIDRIPIQDLVQAARQAREMGSGPASVTAPAAEKLP